MQPRLGRLLLEGQRLGQPERAALAAALLAERDPFAREPDTKTQPSRHRTLSDVLDRVEALEEFERSGRQRDRASAPSTSGAVRFLLQARDQFLLRSWIPGLPIFNHQSSIINPMRWCSGPCLPPFRIGWPAAGPRARRGVMVGGRGVSLAPSSGVTEPELFRLRRCRCQPHRSLVRQASAVQRDWLPPDLVQTTTEVTFHPETERVTSRRRVCYEDLLLEEMPAAGPEADEVARVLAAAAAERLDRVLPPSDSAAGLFLLRVRCLRGWMPDLGLPAFDDAELRELLAWLCPGKRSFEELRRADWLGLLQGRLTHLQAQAVEREAPERLEVPSGSHIALKYELGRPPVLAVRIQELFGLVDTRALPPAGSACCCTCWPPISAPSRSPTTWPASGRTPIPRCARNCEPATRSTPGRRIRCPRRPARAEAAKAAGIVTDRHSVETRRGPPDPGRPGAPRATSACHGWHALVFPLACVLIDVALCESSACHNAAANVEPLGTRG